MTVPVRSPSGGPTLAELLAVPDLRLHLTVDGRADALARQVRWVHSTELPDPSRYLRGGELVCTVGTSLLDAGACDRFVAALRAVDAAGMCFGVGDVHQHTPEAVVAACREAGLPLIEVPHGVRFLALSEYLAEHRIAAQSQVSARGERLVAQLLADVRRGTSPQRLAESVVEHVGGRLVVTLDGTRIAAGAEPDGGFVIDVGAAESVEVRWTGEGEAPSADLLMQVGRVIDVACFEQQTERQRERERIGHLFGLVADGLADVATVLPVVRAAGFGDGEATVSAWPARTGQVLAAALPDSLIAEAPDLTFAVSATAAEIVRAAGALALVCGHGSTLPVTGLARSIAEARACLALARRYGRLVGPHELTSLDGLLEQQPSGRLEPFVTQLVTPLREHDVRHKGQLLNTLRTFVRVDGSLKETARVHFLHVNTVRHRLSRVRELTGRNPLAFDDRTALAIGLWAHDRAARHTWAR